MDMAADTVEHMSAQMRGSEPLLMDASRGVGSRPAAEAAPLELPQHLAPADVPGVLPEKYRYPMLNSQSIEFADWAMSNACCRIRRWGFANRLACPLTRGHSPGESLAHSGTCHGIDPGAICRQSRRSVCPADRVVPPKIPRTLTSSLEPYQPPWPPRTGLP